MIHRLIIVYPIIRRSMGNWLRLAQDGVIARTTFRDVGHGPTLFAGLSRRLDLKLVNRLEFGSGAVAMRYEPRR